MTKGTTLHERMAANKKKQVELLPPPKKEVGQRIGVASGEFSVPDNIDVYNEEISSLFEGL